MYNQRQQQQNGWEFCQQIKLMVLERVFVSFIAESCARVDAVFVKRPDSKGHVKGRLIILIFLCSVNEQKYSVWRNT